MSQHPAHVSAASGEVRAKCSPFLKMQQRFHYLANIKLSPNDLLLMLKCIDLFMKVFFCPMLAVEEAAVRNSTEMKIEAALSFPSSLIVSRPLWQATVCDPGVQHQRTEVPEGRAGCAPVWLRGLPEEDGCRRGETFPRPGNTKQ